MAETVQDLIQQLKQISPMPDDNDLTDEVLEKYGNLVEKLEKTNDPAIIAPLLYSIGFYDAYGGYWTVLHIVEKFGILTTLPHLIEAAKKGQRGTRYWVARMLGGIGTPEVVPSLITLLNDPEEKVRAVAIRFLSRDGNPEFLQYIKPLENDPSPEVREAVKIAYYYMRRS